ncbi:MAG: hypothetical protein JWO76_2394 [Nocardioides sp.]|nr:hypothetical protein [Nocardioides sp.]
MKTSVRRALAATTICAAVAGTLAAGPFASADQARAGSGHKLSAFGYKGTAVGAQLTTGNVQTLSAKDAEAPLRCTRMTGRDVQQSSILSAPDNSLIQLSGSDSKTFSYREAGQYGVRAVNHLGDIVLGGTLPGQDESTPIVTLRGLTTTADAFHTAKGYGHKESFTAPELTIDTSVLTDNGVPIPQELTDLLDALTATGGELAGQVITVLQENGVIEIPQLGSIAMGFKKGNATKHGAESDVKALEFKITATGEEQDLQLGHARAVIGGPAPAGVFRSTSMPLDLKAGDGVLHLGGVQPRTIPCQGTGGRTVHKHLDSASLAPNGIVIGLKGIDYTFRGTQHRDGTADGFDAQRIGSLEIPSLQLSIEGIYSRATSRMNPSGKVVKGHSASVGKITYQGETIAAPAPGKAVKLGDVAVLEGMAFHNNKWGNRVTALRLTLLEDNIVMDLGIAASQVFPY